MFYKKSIKDNKNIRDKTLFFDVSNNCTAEAINASLLDLLNIKNKINEILIKLPFYSNIKTFKYNNIGTIFKFINKNNIKNITVKNIHIFLKQFLLNIKSSNLSLNIQISILRILTNLFQIIENDLLFSVKIKKYFFNIINKLAYNTLIFSYMINHIDPIEINCSHIPISLLSKNIIKKNWIFLASINMPTILISKKIIPCDPLGIIFMKSLISQNNSFNKGIFFKFGKGLNLKISNNLNICRLILYKLDTLNNNNINNLKKNNIFQINAIINTNYIKLTELFNSLEKIGLQDFFTIPIYTFNKEYSHYIYIFFNNYLLEEVSKNIFIYGKCSKIYIKTIECQTIISNIISIPINIGTKNLNYRIKEYILNNNIISIAPILIDLKQSTNTNYINLKIIASKMILLWKRLRYK